MCVRFLKTKTPPRKELYRRRSLCSSFAKEQASCREESPTKKRFFFRKGLFSIALKHVGLFAKERGSALSSVSSVKTHQMLFCKRDNMVFILF